MSVSLERLVRNQALFREVNERVHEVVDRWDGPTEFLCECSDTDCIATVSLERTEYEAVRARPDHFLVLPGHERPEVERVVETNERYAVVEKAYRPELVTEDEDD